MVERLIKFLDQRVYEAAFVVAGSAAALSLILSQVVGLVPCDLCWWQRIFMFPLPFILAISILRSDKHAYAYVLPLAAIGWVIALYQSLLQWGLISATVLKCSAASAVCATPQILWFGFITIPFAALVMFSAITWLMWRARLIDPELKLTSGGQKALGDLLIILLVISLIGIGIAQILK